MMALKGENILNSKVMERWRNAARIHETVRLGYKQKSSGKKEKVTWPLKNA